MSIKALGKNAVVYAVGNICSRAASFILIPIYTHALPMEEYGLLATLLVSVHLMLIFTNMGMRTAFLRFIDELGGNHNIGKLLGTSCLINAFSWMLVTGITFAFFLPFYRATLHIDDVSGYIGIACGAAFLQASCLHIMTYYRARNQPVKYMITGIATAVVLIFSSSYYLYHLKLGISGALLGLVTAHACILLFLIVDVLPRTGIGVSFSLLPELFGFGSPIVLSEMSSVVMESSGIFFLGYFQNLNDVAIYSLGYKFANIFCIAIALPFTLSFQPYFFQNRILQDTKKIISRILTYLVLVTVFIAPCIFLGAAVLLQVMIPPEYSPAFVILLLLIPGIGFNGAISFGDTLLSAAKKTRVIGTTMVIGAFVSILSNYWLIPTIGWHGAVIAQNASLILTGSAVMALGKREYSFSIEWKRITVLTGILSCFIFLHYYLRDIDLVFLIPVTVITLLGSFILLFVFRFFNDKEIISLKNIFGRVQTM